MTRVLAVLALAVVLAVGCSRRPSPAHTYAVAARRIGEAALAGDGGWRRLEQLTDRVGHRISGSPELAKAVAWARDSLAADGHENVALEDVHVPHWTRGEESAAIVAPIARPLVVLGLGGTVGTPPGGVTAPIAVVSSFAELVALGATGVRGKIVVFNHAMNTAHGAGLGYRDAIGYRVSGAMRAAPLGAVAVLVRSLASASLRTPHTGAMRYVSDAPPTLNAAAPPPPAPRIPGAAIAVEDAELLARLAAQVQPVTVHLSMGAQTLPDAPSANVVAELRGRERPEEVVLIGAHLDSWDVGQGAQDDGAGCAIMMEALATLRRLDLRPRRTIRVVLFVAEEQGHMGAAQYAERHRAELPSIVAAIESDAGAGTPLGFSTDGTPPWMGDARAIAHLLAPVGASKIVQGFPGEDVMALKPVPAMGLYVDISHYFDVHHSPADTLDKIDPDHMRHAVAAVATMAYVLADRQERW